MESQVIDLGCQNGWKKNPEKYDEHLASCGVPREFKFYVMNKLEMRTELVYPNVTRQNIGRCYNRYTCEKCNCSWTVDSSD